MIDVDPPGEGGRLRLYIGVINGMGQRDCACTVFVDHSDSIVAEVRRENQKTFLLRCDLGSASVKVKTSLFT